jgi:hypothetical protein
LSIQFKLQVRVLPRSVHLDRLESEEERWERGWGGGRVVDRCACARARVCVCVCLSVCVCLCVCLSVCLFFCLCVCLSVFVSTIRGRCQCYLNVTACLQTVEPNKYDALALFHTGVATFAAHGGPGFPGWHRVYLLL